MIMLHKYFAQIIKDYEDCDFYKSDDGIFMFFGCTMASDMPFLDKGDYVEEVIFDFSDGTVRITEKHGSPTYVCEIKPEIISISIKKNS